MRKILIIAIAFFMFGGISQAQQKFGHVNFGNLLESMPEVTTANVELEAYQETLLNEFEFKKQAFEAKFAGYQREYAEGLMSRAKQEQVEIELREEQQTLMIAQNELGDRIQQKRAELLSPLVERLQKAIDAVGEEGGYSMIFDVSLGALLHAKDSQNLDAQVKAKL